MNIKLIFLSIFSFLILTSCSDDDFGIPVELEGDFANGIFILNEGNSSGGSLSFMTSDFSETTQNAYKSVNPDDDLGLFVQSIFFDDQYAYIISNGSNMITIVNRYTLEFVDRIDSGLNVPMYGLILNGKAYVTNQADFSTTADDYVAVIDLASRTVENTIVLGSYAEKIYEFENKIYVQNASYGFGDKVSKLNIADQTVEQTLSFSSAISDTYLSNGKLYVLAQDEISQVNLTNFQTSSTWSLAETHVGASRIAVEGNAIYFTSSNSVYNFTTSDDTISETALFNYETTSAFGTFYGFDVHNGFIYLSDGTDFASNGFIQIRNSQGDLIKEQEVGIGPNSFYFN
ncbi:YncE family protein [Psychroflexus sp. ALD_RP9]|uniref:YncE family protein n=1 Tax=Psychroflexus sp. ALD_RP9 TaxID=2777186 RepID=UPI001A8DFE03|nr:cell surface protein [Psychroflexus sp. ALD_RP9]QSS96536.1 cell surface protein [Psychroflexus sp. ALD_RP9]